MVGRLCDAVYSDYELMNVVREKHRDAGEGSWDGMIADVGGEEVAAGPAALGEDDAAKEDEYD